MTAEFFKYFNEILMQLFIYWSISLIWRIQNWSVLREKTSPEFFKEFLSNNETATEFFKKFDQIGCE